MLKPIFEEGIPICPCGSQQFWVQFQETVSYRLNAIDKGDGWGETEILESDGPDPILGVVCYECDEDIEVTPEMEKFIRKIGG